MKWLWLSNKLILWLPWDRRENYMHYTLDPNTFQIKRHKNQHGLLCGFSFSFISLDFQLTYSLHLSSHEQGIEKKKLSAE